MGGPPLSSDGQAGGETSAADDRGEGSAAATAGGWVRLLPARADQDGNGDPASENAGGWKQVLPLDPQGQPDDSDEEPATTRAAGQMKPPAAPPIPEPPKSHLEPGPEDHDETAAEAWLTALEVVTKVEGKKAGGYHSRARHRAELTDGQLEGRMTKGKLPAGQPKACTVEHHVPIYEGFRPAAGADRRKGEKDELLP